MENNTSKDQPNTSYQKYIILQNTAWKHVPERLFTAGEPNIT